MHLVCILVCVCFVLSGCVNPTSVKSPSFSISINALFLTLLSCLILALGSSVRVREREEGFFLLFFFLFCWFLLFFFVGTEEERPRLYPCASLSSRACKLISLCFLLLGLLRFFPNSPFFYLFIIKV